MGKLSVLGDNFDLVEENAHSKSTSLQTIDDTHFVAPKELLLMYQKMSMTGFKIWACFIADLASKSFTDQLTNMPISRIWSVLGHRLSLTRLEQKLDELQQTLIKQDAYLPEIDGYQRTSFQALGTSGFTYDNDDEVLSIQYKMVTELLTILKSEDKDMFLIEMNVLRHLKGDDSAEAAKNLILFCTPYVDNRRTPAISYVDLKAFMNKSDKYITKTGEHDTKEFNRRVLKKAQSTVNENQFVSFSIDSIQHVYENKKAVACYFTLSPKSSNLSDLLPSDVDPTTPVQPKRLDTILENYWKEQAVNSQLSYERDMLLEILERLHLVKKYREDFIEQSDYAINPAKGTFQILSIVTAIFQLWIDGHFKKDGSKIYKYALQVFKSPRPDQIASLNQKYRESRRIDKEKAVDSLAIANQNRKLASAARRLKMAINRYNKHRFELALATYSEEDVINKDSLFRHKVLNNEIKATWVAKLLKDAPEDSPIAEVLRRNSLDYYKRWLINQAAQDEIITDQTVEDFIATYPDSLRDITFLKVQTNVEFFIFETNVEDLTKRFK